MTACGYVLILSLCIFTISYCEQDTLKEVSTKETEVGNENSIDVKEESDQSKDKDIIIILSVAVGILSAALIVTCTIIFLQRRRLNSYPKPGEPNSPKDNPILAINPEDNIAFVNEDIQEDSDRGTPPQGGSDNFSINQEGLDDRTDNQPRVRSSTVSHDELSEVVTNDQLNDPHSLRRTPDEDENIRGHSEQCDSNATVTDDKHLYQNLDKDGKLILIYESQLAEAGETAAAAAAEGGAEGGRKTDIETKAKKDRYKDYDNVIIPKGHGGLLISNSNDNDGEYMDMSLVQRTREDPSLCVPPPMAESPSEMNISNLPHYGLEEDRSGSGKSSPGNSLS